MYDAYHNKLIEITDKNALYIILLKKPSKPRLKPWITSNILKSIKIKNLYHKKFLKTQKRFGIIGTNTTRTLKQYNI